ncbi:hypothetical protein MFUL124B02_24925 [Myxococcus fulvus 124B02]|nr:hypothetical protein MFUL124B02_24925 [Myxococcus fulvus 124B02]
MALVFLGGCGGAQEGVSVSQTEVIEQERDALVTRTVSIIAMADTHVSSAQPTSSFGSSQTMVVGRAPESEAYLRFFVAPIPEGRITTARLRVYAIEGSSDGPTAHGPGVYRSWNEETTWNTRPVHSTSWLATSAVVPDGSWMEFDVTNVHVGPNSFSDLFLKADGDDSVTIASSEHPDPALRPQLLLTVESAPDHPTNPLVPFAVATPPLTLVAVADTFVSADAPTSSAGGSADTLVVGNAPEREVHLRFNVQGLPETVQRAVLRLHLGFDGTTGGPSVFATQGPWNESSVTWNTRPTKTGRELDRMPFLEPWGYVDYDVTAHLRANGSVTLGLYGRSADEVTFHSRESDLSSANPPQLLIWTGTPREAPMDACLTRRELQTTTVLPLHDTYVDALHATRTFHREATLRVDASPGAVSYLDFDVKPFPGQVRRVLLQLYALEATGSGPRIFKAQPFDPYTISWHQQPTTLYPFGDLGPVKKDQWVEYDVTNEVTAPGRHAFGLVPDSSDGLSFASVDAHWGYILHAAPRLVIVTESEPFCSYRGTNPAGGMLQGTQAGRPEAERSRDTASVPGGGFVVLSAVEQTLDSTPWSSQTDVVTLHREDGGVAWSREFPQANVEFRKVTVTTLGNVLVAGEYRGAPDLGKGALPLAGNTGLFVMKLTPSGAVDWTRGYTAWFDDGTVRHENPMAVYDLATDAHGSAVVTGSFWGSTDFGGGELRSGKTFPYDESLPNSFIVKLQWDGAYAWAQTLKSPGIRGAQAMALTVDAQENITVGGTTGQGIDFGDGPVYRNGLFVARWSPSGVYQWSRVMGVNHSRMSGVVVLPDGGVVFAASFEGGLAFGGRTYASKEPDEYEGGPWDAVLGRLGPTGEEVSLRHFQQTPARSSFFQDLVLDGAGNLVVSLGGFGGLLGLGEVGPPGVTSPPRPAVASFTASLETRWVRVLDVLQSDLRLAPGAEGIIVTGDFAGAFELDGTWYTSTAQRSDLLHFKLRR